MTETGSPKSPAPYMGPSEAITSCFQQYVGFSGRASRSEYWFFFLFKLVLVSIVGLAMPPLAPLVNLVLLLPFLAVTVRRLHDTGRTAWHFFAPWP